MDIFAWLPSSDFQIFWNIGRSLINGLDPYLSVFGSWYPPATTLLFAGFAMFSVQFSYLAWLLINAMLLVGVARKKALVLLFFYPISHLFFHGQLDLALFALLPLLKRRNWQSLIAVALITLKPHVAMIILPWYLARWLIEDRKLLAKSALVTLGLHISPVLVRPTILAEWFAVLGKAAGHKAGGTGIWRFFELPTSVVLVIALLIMAIAVFQNREKLCRVILFATSPFIAAYDAVVLVDTTPIWLLIPVSWIALALAHAFESFSLFPIIPFTCLAWSLTRNYRQSRVSTEPFFAA